MQLDTLVPYLTVAITSAGLAAVDHSKHAALSPSRLLFASGALLSAAGKASTCVFQIRKVIVFRALPRLLWPGGAQGDEGLCI